MDLMRLQLLKNKVMIGLVKLLFTGHYNIYNFDYVGAKTGKHLTKTEEFINYWGNWLPTKVTILWYIALRLFIVFTIVKLLIWIWK